MRPTASILATLALAAHATAAQAAGLPELPDPAAIPRLTDAHYHLRGVGERELTLNLAGARSLAALQGQLRAWAEAHPDAPWLTGRGWLETHFEPPVFPTREDLDAVVPDRPVFLTRADGHGGVANLKALALASVDRDTRPPFGGEILRDAEGEPTGMLIDRVMGLVRQHISADGRLDRKEALRAGGEVAARQGWVTVHYVAVRWPSRGADHLLGHGPIIGEFDGRLTIRAIKINLDGALGSRGAALLAPYADDPGNTGLLTHTPAPSRLGPERLRYAYAWRALLDAGAVVIGGSDAPVEVGDPRIELHAAVTRTDLEGFSGPGWHPEQAVTPGEAVKMFSEWAAYAAFEQ